MIIFFFLFHICLQLVAFRFAFVPFSSALFQMKLSICVSICSVIITMLLQLNYPIWLNSDLHFYLLSCAVPLFVSFDLESIMHFSFTRGDSFWLLYHYHSTIIEDIDWTWFYSQAVISSYLDNLYSCTHVEKPMFVFTFLFLFQIWIFTV